MSELIGKTVFKFDVNKPFTEEQISFAKSHNDVTIEVQDERIVVLSQTEQLANTIATVIAQKFHSDLHVKW